MAAASGDRPIQNVLGNPNDFNDLYRPPSVKVVVFYNRERQNSNTGAILILRIGSAASIPIASHERNLERLLGHVLDRCSGNLPLSPPASRDEPFSPGGEPPAQSSSPRTAPGGRCPSPAAVTSKPA